MSSLDETCKMWQLLNKDEKWWYGCDWPVPPHPTYHIDDKLLSARLLYWCAMRLNVVGNFYWRMNYCRVFRDGKDYPIDPYNVYNPYLKTWGEGFLVYPGRFYGLDNFLPSIRLEAVRDSAEDYEALYCLKKLWEKGSKEYGVSCADFNQLLEPVYSRMFNVVRLLDKPLITFDFAREYIATSLVLAGKYDYTLFQLDETKGELTFAVRDLNVVCSNGVLTRREDVYTLLCREEKAHLIFDDGKRKFELFVYMKSVRNKAQYALDVNWASTAEKYGIDDCDGWNILQPYYASLNEEDEEELNRWCKELSRLTNFVWKGECVIVKRRTGADYTVVFTIPHGEIRSSEVCQKVDLKDGGSSYVFKIQKEKLKVELENETGRYTLDLLL